MLEEAGHTSAADRDRPPRKAAVARGGPVPAFSRAVPLRKRVPALSVVRGRGHGRAGAQRAPAGGALTCSAHLSGVAPLEFLS